MKKLIMICSVALLMATVVTAQSRPDVTIKTHHAKVKVKKKKSIKNRLHNAIHPKHKHYSGVKVKHETE